MSAWKRFEFYTLIALLAVAAPTVSAKGKAAAKKPLDELRLVEGDEKGNEEKSLKAELLVSASENKAIQQALKLIKKYKGTPLEPDLHFRLAELYMRRSKTDRFFEVHRESETIVKLAPRVARASSVKNSVQKAVDTYGVIQTRFPSFGQMDLVVYNRAFAYQILGQEKDAENLYWQLISKHPNSPLVPDAHLAIGEIAFNRAQFALALDHFNAIKKYPNSRVYPYGLYKAAWTYYNMRDAQKGLKKLEEVVAYGKYISDNKLEARLDLRKEALNDMTLFYEDVYPAKDAYSYFKQQAGELEVGPILLKMGSLYERHSRFNEQRVVLDRFIQELPTSPLLPKVHTDLVLAFDHLRQKDQSVNRLNEFAKLCNSSSSWSKGVGKTPEENKKSAEECLTSLNETSLKLAKKWLKSWKKLPSDTSYADASEKAFEIYLRTPGQGEEYAQSRFAYAELLFARQKFRKASQEYAAVGHVSAPGALNHDASYGALISLEKAVGEKWSNEDEKSFHQLAQDYIAKNPKGQYRLDIEYKMALLAYEKERYDEAAPTFLRLGRDFAKQEKGLKSQDLYLDILNIKKDYRGIRNYTKELMKGGTDVARTQKMRKLYEQAYFLEVQGLEEKGQLKEALAEYIGFFKQNPSSDLAEKAMWNAMQLHFKVGDAWNGAKAAEEFATRYPQSPQSVNALLRAAQTFEQMAQLGEAARVLEKLAARDEKNATRWKELAADFHAMNGAAPSARRLYNDLKTAANAEKRKTLLNKLDALEQAYGTDQSRAEIQRVLIDQNVQPQANLAKVRSIEALLDAGKDTEAFNQARHYLGSSGMSPNEKARLRMVHAKILEQEFLKQSVKSRAERVATVLAIKTEKLQKVQEALQSAIKFGDPKVSLDAFERLYGCYAHYVKALKEMPVPAGLSKEDAQAFRAELDKLVIPLEEKSVDTLAQAVTFAHKQQFLDGTAARLENELAKLNQQSTVNVAPELRKPAMVVPVLSGVGI
jgi:TolA-binding protein